MVASEGEINSLAPELATVGDGLRPVYFGKKLIRSLVLGPWEVNPSTATESPHKASRILSGL